MSTAMQRPVIVLVDDDPAVADALGFSLGLEGFDVRAHRDADALMAADVIPARSCLVLSHRPPALDGLALLERLRAADVTAPGILLATNPWRSLRVRAAAAGVPIVEKPLLTDALLTAIRAAIRSRS